MSIDLNLEHVAPAPTRKDYRIGAIGAGFIMSDCHLVAYGRRGTTWWASLPPRARSRNR